MKVVVLSLLCLTTFALSASAEAARILWRQEEQGPNVGWTTESATEALAECNTASLRQVLRAVNAMKLIFRLEDGYVVGADVPDVYMVIHRDDVGKIPSDRRHFPIVAMFNRLPDTIDPRGPKGK